MNSKVSSKDRLFHDRSLTTVSSWRVADLHQFRAICQVKVVTLRLSFKVAVKKVQVPFVSWIFDNRYLNESLASERENAV